VSPHRDVTEQRRVNVVLPFELVVALDRYRYEHRFFSRSAVITEAVREFLGRRAQDRSHRAEKAD
jgi:metal-responsive CopG/Arc/MetJ family transcriptional regulator